MTKYQAIIYRQESQICHLTFPWIHDGLRLSWKYGQDGLYMIPSIVTNPPLNSQHSTFGRGLKCVLNFCGPSTAIIYWLIMIRIASSLFDGEHLPRAPEMMNHKKKTHDLYKLILGPIKNKTGQAWSHLNIHRIFTNIIIWQWVKTLYPWWT